MKEMNTDVIIDCGMLWIEGRTWTERIPENTIKRKCVMV